MAIKRFCDICGEHHDTPPELGGWYILKLVSRSHYKDVCQLDICTGCLNKVEEKLEELCINGLDIKEDYNV